MDRSAGREYLEKYIVFSEQKRVFWCETIAQSLKLAHNKSELRDLICVTGSLFAVGEAREQLNSRTVAASGRISM
jgi:folylpolyglutamate synthase/dihydropteroate synthase